MESRFGFKDLVVVVLVVVLILVVFLGMKQLDRQWALLQSIRDQGADQVRALTDINRTLQSGAFARNASATRPSGNDPSDPGYRASFAPLLEAEAKPDFSRGDWLIDNFGTKLPKVTPLISSDLYSQWVQSKVVEGLIYRDPNTLEYVPQLATSWKASDDGMTYTFKIRQGVRFSDGEPMTVDDVLYSYQVIMNPKVNCPRQRAYYEKIKSVEKKGDDEVVFTMAEPYFESLDLCGTLSILPKHFYTQFTPEEFNENPGLLMGTGPYRMPDPKSWRPGQQKVELVRNEFYWGEAGSFNRYVFLEVEEEAAEETMFGNRELDVYAPPAEQFKRLLNDPKVTARANSFTTESPMNGYAYIAWNEKHNGTPTRFNDPRVRKAMTMLTDRDRLIREVWLGYATAISGPFAAASPQADPAIKPLPYDVAAATKLLAEAGFTDPDHTGVLKGPDGQQFKFKLSYPSGNASFERVVKILKDGYARGGVTMEPDPIEWSILLQKMDRRDFDAITLQWGGSVESDLYQEFDSSQQADQGDNFMAYANPALDAKVREARKTVDAKKRMDIWHQAHAILADDQPYTFLASRMSLRFMDKRVANVSKSKVGLNYVYVYTMPSPWYVSKGQQKYAN